MESAIHCIESRIHFGATSEFGMRKPLTRDPGPAIPNTESTGWDLESEGHLDSLTQGETEL